MRPMWSNGLWRQTVKTTFALGITAWASLLWFMPGEMRTIAKATLHGIEQILNLLLAAGLLLAGACLVGWLLAIYHKGTGSQS